MNKKKHTNRLKFEYPIKCSVAILFLYLTEPGKLEKWFADKVWVEGKEYIFQWTSNEKRMASLKQSKNNVFAKFCWNNSEEYLEFRIKIDDITKDINLIITDFHQEDESVDDLQRLWDSQIEMLHRIIG